MDYEQAIKEDLYNVSIMKDINVRLLFLVGCPEQLIEDRFEDILDHIIYKMKDPRAFYCEDILDIYCYEPKMNYDLIVRIMNHLLIENENFVVKFGFYDIDFIKQNINIFCKYKNLGSKIKPFERNGKNNSGQTMHKNITKTFKKLKENYSYLV